MDFNNIHGQDVSNFPTSSPHRLPTVSAAQALSDLTSSPTRVISTKIPQLDGFLQNQDASNQTDEPFHGGISRGQVTEIYGPPGVGKTAMGIQLTANVLAGGEKVVWIDAAHVLPGPRLLEVLSSSVASIGNERPDSSSEIPTTSLMLRNLKHITIPSLPHLLALFSQRESTFPAEGTSLIIIDSLSTLMNSAFPKSNNTISIPSKPAAGAKTQPNKHDAAHWASTRKWAVLHHLITLFSKIAALKNLAIVILQQTATKMRDGAGAGLVPSISSPAWEAGIACRMVLFRDWGPENSRESVRYAGVLKAEGIVGPANGGLGRVVAFAIRESGIVPTILPSSTPQTEHNTKSAAGSRHISKLEIGDSEGEDELGDSDDDYGWDEEDDANIVTPPPPTQGSEDLLVPGEELGEEEEEEEVEEGLEG